MRTAHCSPLVPGSCPPTGCRWCAPPCWLAWPAREGISALSALLQQSAQWLTHRCTHRRHTHPNVCVTQAQTHSHTQPHSGTNTQPHTATHTQPHTQHAPQARLTDALELQAMWCAEDLLKRGSWPLPAAIRRCLLPCCWPATLHPRRHCIAKRGWARCGVGPSSCQSQAGSGACCSSRWQASPLRLQGDKQAWFSGKRRNKRVKAG